MLLPVLAHDLYADVHTLSFVKSGAVISADVCIGRIWPGDDERPNES